MPEIGEDYLYSPDRHPRFGPRGGGLARRPRRMDNHADRPEFREAMAGEGGRVDPLQLHPGPQHDVRGSTLETKRSTHGVVRASLPMKAIAGAITGALPQSCPGGTVGSFPGGGPGLFIARRISGPLNNLQRGALRFARGDLDRNVAHPHTAELASLAEALNYMAERPGNKIQSLTGQGQEQSHPLQHDRRGAGPGRRGSAPPSTAPGSGCSTSIPPRPTTCRSKRSFRTPD